VRGGPDRAERRASAGEPNTTEVRERARARGNEVKDRRRVVAELMARFKTATGQHEPNSPVVGL